MNTIADKNRTGMMQEKSQVVPAQETGQYTLWQILGIWLVGGAPMWILGWLAYPALSQNLSAVNAGLLRLKLLTIGLIWEFVLAMIILYREEGNLRLSTIRRRFWLNNPISPKTGQKNNRLWWLLIPLILLVVALEFSISPVLNDLWVKLFPFLAQPQGYDGSALYAPEVRVQWIGAWGLLALIVVQSLFNTFLGEEFLFRGVLLPKMKGVFGKWDWLANAIIFTLYHLHQPWDWPNTFLTALVFVFPAKRFRSNWFSIILHSGQSIFFIVLVLGLVLGLAK